MDEETTLKMASEHACLSLYQSGYIQQLSYKIYNQVQGCTRMCSVPLCLLVTKLGIIKHSEMISNVQPEGTVLVVRLKRSTPGLAGRNRTCRVLAARMIYGLLANVVAANRIA
jgi:hypothetical protein